MIRKTVLKGKLHALVIAALILSARLILFSGCGEDMYSNYQSTVEPVNVNGLLAKIEYHRDSELVNSMLFINWNDDSIIDGKSGPTDQNQWTKGWEWFDELTHNDSCQTIL